MRIFFRDGRRSENRRWQLRGRRRGLAELERHAALLFIDPAAETHLMYLVPKFMQAPLPEDWSVSADEFGGKLYRYVTTGRASQYHPLSYYYASVAQLERLSGKESGPPLRMDPDGQVVIDRDVADYLLKDQATLQDVRTAMEYLGVGDDDSEDLLRLAIQYYLAPLPPAWRRIQMPDSSLQFFNIDTGEKSAKGPMFNLFFEKANSIRKCSTEQQQPASETKNDATAENKITHKESTAHPVAEVLIPQVSIMDAHPADKAGNFTLTEGILREASAHEVEEKSLFDNSDAGVFNTKGCVSQNVIETKMTLSTTFGKSPAEIEATKGVRLPSRESPIIVCESFLSPSDHVRDQYPSKDSVESVIQLVLNDDASAQDAVKLNNGLDHVSLKNETNISTLSCDIYKKPGYIIPPIVPMTVVHAHNRTAEDTLTPCPSSEDSVKDFAEQRKSATNDTGEKNHPDVVGDVIDRKNCKDAIADIASVGDRQRKDCAWYISGYKKASSLLASRTCYLLMDAVLKATQNT